MAIEKKKDTSMFGAEKTEKEVAVKATTAVDTTTARAEGTENISADDVQLARFRLIQVTSSEAESGSNKPGTIKNSLSEETYEKVELILITMFKNRVMFDPDNRKGGPICRSFDMFTGSSCECGCNANCKACQYQKGFPPQCNVLYNYPCITVENVGKEMLPTVLSFMKSSTPVAQKVNASVVGKVPAQPFWNYVWEIGSVKKDYKKNRSAFVYTAKIVRETTTDERSWAELIFKTFLKDKTEAQRRVAEAVAEVESEA
jgi:hypothetical protein